MSKGLKWCTRCGKKRVIYDGSRYMHSKDPWICLNCNAIISKKELLELNNSSQFRTKIYDFGDN